MEAQERWLPVYGYEGLYDVSDQGRVRRMAPYLNTYVGRILKPARNSKGYYTVALYRNGVRAQHSLHAMVASAFCPKPEGATQVNHISGNKADNRASQLEWCTGSQNVKHAIRNGLRRVNRFEKHPMHKLTADQVRDIRCRYAAGGITMEALGREFGVCLGSVWMIVRNKIWRLPAEV